MTPQPKHIHRCSVCSVNEVETEGSVCNHCREHGTTRTFGDPDAILLNLLLWKTELQARNEKRKRGK